MRNKKNNSDPQTKTVYSSTAEFRNFVSFLEKIEYNLENRSSDPSLIGEIKNNLLFKIPVLKNVSQFEKLYKKTFFKKRRK